MPRSFPKASDIHVATFGAILSNSKLNTGPKHCDNGFSQSYIPTAFESELVENWPSDFPSLT